MTWDKVQPQNTVHTNSRMVTNVLNALLDLLLLAEECITQDPQTVHIMWCIRQGQNCTECWKIQNLKYYCHSITAWLQAVASC